MDSLTQIVLGSAVAQATLGKKIGNRAMVWGAIAGTIPDLDVIANWFMTPVDALAFHRGPTHSAFNLILFSFLLGWLVHKMYQLPYHKWFGIISWSLLAGSIGIAIIAVGDLTVKKIIIGISIMVLSGYVIYKRYTREKYDTPMAGSGDWIWMFLLVLLTHPILDCFTTYGTQILIPFSNQRVAFNNIAVADPLYTVPFLLCLVFAMFYHRSDTQRAVWNRRGLIISCLYMGCTIFNKTRVNTIFENSLSQSNIEYKRYMTTPTILNNVLWSGIAETDSAYYYGMYSFLDKEKTFKLKKLDKNRDEFKDGLENDYTLKTLRWFSDDYFVLKQKNHDTLEYYDLRFGTFRTKASDPDQFVFKFNITKKSNGSYYLIDQGERPRDANFSEAFNALWDRILGRTL